MKKPKKSIYTLRVRGLFLYKIKADTEKEARQILEEKGGIDIDGELFTESYANAHLIAREENKEKNR